MSGRKIYLIAASLITVILAALVFFSGSSFSVNRIARSQVKKETASLKSSEEKYLKEADSLKSQIDSLAEGLEDGREINKEFIALKKENDTLKSTIKALELESRQLDVSINEQKNKLEASKTVTERDGGSYRIEKDRAYRSPSDIPSGRYRVSGSGTLIIYSSNGRARETENLDSAHDNSYTFNLEENESIKVTGDALLTEIIKR